MPDQTGRATRRAAFGPHRRGRGTVVMAGSSMPFLWQRVKACPIYTELTVWGEYGYRRNTDADEDDQGSHVAWEVWHWPTNSAESDWFTQIDAIKETRRLYAEMRWPSAA